MRVPSQILGDLLELVDRRAVGTCCDPDRTLEAMIEVIVDQRSLGVADGVFDRVKLLCQVEAWPTDLDHLDHAGEMSGGTLQAPDDVGVRLMQRLFWHDDNLSPWRGYGKTALVMVGLMFAALSASADVTARFHCHGMMGGHMKNGTFFDGILDNDLAYDEATHVIAHEQNGKVLGSWLVTIDGQVLRWSSNENQEYLDLATLNYGFRASTDEGEAYGTASCTRTSGTPP